MKCESSYILLRSLRFHAFHGVEAQERLVGNDYEISLRLKVDVSRAVLSDQVDDTINYAEVYQLVAEVMTTPVNLVEYLAGAIGERLFQRWSQIEAIDVTVLKFNPPMGADCQGAGVELHLTPHRS